MYALKVSATMKQKLIPEMRNMALHVLSNPAQWCPNCWMLHSCFCGCRSDIKSFVTQRPTHAQLVKSGIFLYSTILGL